MNPFHLLLFLTVAAAQSCTPWKLPWDTYNGIFNKTTQICVYSNVRFASPPTGDLRFAAPEYPPKIPNGMKAFPTPPTNPSCYQMKETECSPGKSLIGDNQGCLGGYFGTQSEDCLFLDVHVPAVALKSTKPLPVVIWIYGGGFVFGSKTQYDPIKYPFYDGTGFIDKASEENKRAGTSVIWVVGNYRMGAFGWLAGQYMEKNGQPNAGLLDQRAVMNVTHDYISFLNGDPNRVSVWGESAGASSIMHHLAMPENIKKPLFQKALVQSPAYQWLWDRNGRLNRTFTYFAGNVSELANCKQADMNCLRQVASADNLRQVNQELFQDLACTGILPVGPSVDGKYIPDLAPYQYYKNQGKLGFTTYHLLDTNATTVVPLDTIVVSHVNLEVPYSNDTTSFSFIPRPIRANPNSEPIFQNFLSDVFGGSKYAQIRAAISSKYPVSAYSDQIARAVAVITDSSFTCNTRFMIDRYTGNKSPAYALDYAVLMNYGKFVFNASVHASDLLPAFANRFTNYTEMFQCVLNDTKYSNYSGLLNTEIADKTRPGMQQYFTDHAIWGDPNHNNGIFWAYPWNTARNVTCIDKRGMPSMCVGNLLKAETAIFGSVWSANNEVDIQTSSGICGFWQDIAQKTSAVAAGASLDGRLRIQGYDGRAKSEMVFEAEL